ncbi:DNA polymerase III subunit epsilon [Candidatus Blochmannia ocreatus (nom. nud.)]|uniref:DNA polymerase III subunit epsilon n=1 Tax=Candidatus Blochmannia ocreatus (nom. nud.) TaxID=251538 RepID=A0ABY4SVC3_9ENTR|nr:DNA polymerase III subunit epsilon [Candidatus Blochmannia ocreatus]URJ25297.1 DNA polymerase III subunit epsilon [Candidatus Blochmannia ocreatus]
MIINTKRQVILDTETTGMNKFGAHYTGHRIIEIGAVEIINRRITNKKFHTYLNPNRTIDMAAFQIHGISDQFLINKPNFSEIKENFLTFIKNSELIIHNALFDIGFLNQELKICDKNTKNIEHYCTIIDSLKVARKKFPGQRNSLDALCERYRISNIRKNLHSALVDAETLANVFLCMNEKQIEINFTENIHENAENNNEKNFKTTNTVIKSPKITPLKIIYADEKEKLNHENYLDDMQKIHKCCIWRE